MLLHFPHPTDSEPPPFELKGSLFTLTVLHLFQLDEAAIERHLAEKIKQAPSFFDNTPVVIDLEGMALPPEGVNFNGLYELLRKHGMAPVGVRNGSPELQATARLAGLPVLPESRSSGVSKKSGRAEPALAHAQIIDHPVRSGQQFYAPDGDLIVLGAVSAGADVIADGNVHVYGVLRGRALAGIKGNAETRIFCHSLEAALISIAGRYRVSEHISPTDWGKAGQIRLMDDHLVIEPLIR